MNEQSNNPWKTFQEKWVSRRNLIRGAAGTALGAGLVRPMLGHARDEEDDRGHGVFFGPHPIPGGNRGLSPGPGLQPYGVFVHHNPLNPATALANISDPSQITDFDGFVGLTNIHGGGTGTDTNKGMATRLSFRADMGFSQGNFVATDGQVHKGTFAFV